MSNYSDKAIEIFHALLRSAISTGENVDLQGAEDIAAEIYALAKAQDVLGLICNGIEKNNGVLPPETEQARIRAVYRHAQNEYALKKAKEALNAGRIAYIPLKGSAIKHLYPEPWMRNCIDIDILVHEKDIDKAVQVLTEAGYKTDGEREYHDVSLYYGITHLELHFSICENIPRIDSVLERVWKYTEPVSEYEYRETDEFFVFHIVTHMLYHFLRGGCNIKQFVDLWLLRKNSAYDEIKLQSLLNTCRLGKFYKVICAFTDCYFEGNEQTELFRKIETQILNGGIIKRKTASDNISITVGGGIKKYILNSVFLPKREMEWIYPQVKKHPVLLPLYYTKRMITKTIGKDKNRAKEVMKACRKSPDETEKLLNDMGLS